MIPAKKPVPPRTLTVTEAGPLLPFLLAQVKGQSRNAVKAILARGEVCVNGKISKQFDLALRVGQTVTLQPPRRERAATLPFPIIFEDEFMLAINKPAGLLTMANEHEKTRTAYHIVTDFVKSADPARRIFIVHRLDQDTSGVVLFAKNEDVKHHLQDQWEDLVESRHYTAVVEGKPPEAAGLCHSWLLETSTHLVYSTETNTGGKEATTRYEVLQSGGGYSLLDIALDTGRKNQIRVHMQDMGCPISGDKKYNGQPSPLGRLCLHSHELVMRHPETGEPLVLTAPVPPEFARLCRTN